MLCVRGRARGRKDHHEADTDQRRNGGTAAYRAAARVRRRRRAARVRRAGRGVMHRQAPAAPSTAAANRCAAILGRSKHVERCAARREQDHRRRVAQARAPAARPRPSSIACTPGTPSARAPDFAGRLADCDQRLRALADRRRPSRRTPSPSSGRRRSGRSVRSYVRSAAMTEAGIRRFRVVDVAHAVDLRDRSQPVRHGLEGRRSPGAAMAIGQPTASAASSAAITFCTLCSPANGISLARHDRHRARIPRHRRVHDDSVAHVHRRLIARVQREPELSCLLRAYRRDASRALRTRGSSRLPTNQSVIDWLAQIRYFASAYSSIEW